MEIAKLIPEEDRVRVGIGIHRAVELSFDEDVRRARSARMPEPRITRREAKRRFEISLRIYRQLRGDLKWGSQRALDMLPRYLRCELDQTPWTPDQRKIWVPGDG